MILYCTSKNSGPSYRSDHIYMKYLGTSIEEAEQAVGDFSKYQRAGLIPDATSEFFSYYSALPKSINWNIVKFYIADGWWYSIVEFELKEE